MFEIFFQLVCVITAVSTVDFLLFNTAGSVVRVR